MSRDVSRPHTGGAKADRDRIVEQALKHELRGAPDVLSECIDAETLAAWHDGALPPAQVSTVELHVSSCARCQAMLGAFARGSEAVAVTNSSSAPFWRWRWWLAPLAASAAAVTLWMVVPEQQQIATRPPERPTAAVDTLKERAPAAAPAAQAPADATAPAPPQKKEPTLESARPAESKAKEDSLRQQESQLKDAVPPLAKLEAPSPPPPSAAAAPAPAASAPARAREERADAPAIATTQRSAAFNFAAPMVISPDAGRRWRSVAAGIERSEDGGATWTLVHESTGESLTAGAAPSSTVCWFAGRGGIVLVTGDGSTFTRVDLPARADITAIEAADARTATVTTPEGRRFRTDDSGRTWRPF